MAILITLENYGALIPEYVKEHGLSHANTSLLRERIDNGIVKSMSSHALAYYAGEVAASMITQHPDYGRLAAVILASYHTAVTTASFSEKIRLLDQYVGNLKGTLVDFVATNSAEIDAYIDYSRDFNLSYFALNSLIRSYMLRINDTPIERPQDIFMRVAVQICGTDLRRIKETYDLISLGIYTHSTPTLFNSLLEKSQLASCFLVTIKGDDISGIFETIGDCALISKHSGGLGVNLHEIRCAGSPLVSSGGASKGIIPIMRIINETMKYVNQGGTKRNSSIAFYLEPWHCDIMQFIDVRKNTGPEEYRAREVFVAIWMNDLFMERVINNEEWSLFDPNQAKGLHEVWGDEFRKLYTKYEKTVSRKTIRAQDLWKQIVIAQVETGTPYIVYKDTCNRLSNQNHLGTIKCSNLCAEIVEYSSKEETAVCNLASVCLPKLVKNGSFDFDALRRVIGVIVRNLNTAIDCTFYPTKETRTSNLKHRPIAIGVQGLADVFIALRLPYESDGARRLNKLIFETMYYSAIEASMEMAKIFGPHESFVGSNLSKGVFQFDIVGVKPSEMWDWETLRANVVEHGTRNSLFIALMPTAGTSQIFGNTECFEPITSNIFTRRTIAGEFQVVNTSLMTDLMNLGLWSEEMRHLIIEYDGSIQNIPLIPQHIKDLYKTVWEIKMRSVVDMAIDRQPYIDQSQSLNIFMERPTYQSVSSMHFHGWKNGLKTGLYYLRSKPISSAIKFTVDQELVERTLSSLQEMENSKGDSENMYNTCESCSC